MPKLRGVSFWVLMAAVVGLGTLGGLADKSASSTGSATAGIISIAQEDNRAMMHLDHLVNDIGSRPVDSVASLQAYKWARNEFWKFGLDNAHLERCGETEGNFSDRREADKFRRLHRALFDERPDGDLIPICNVVADIPGADLPNEYVIVGAHLDSAPAGPGATDNGTGVAAVMEAARLLAESGARPRRTIRFILFGGEEVGLVGSKGYLEAHPELIPRISAVYNMDHGANYISGVQATAPLAKDMRTAFSAVAGLAPDMPFRVENVDYLPSADPNCCGSMVKRIDGENGKVRVDVPWSEGGAGGCGGSAGCGSGGGISTGGAKSSCGTTGGGKSACGSANSFGDQPGTMVKKITADGDTAIMYVSVPGAPDGGAGLNMEDLDLESLGISLDELKNGSGRVKRVIAVGSSDHAAFLAAGVPAFWWTQDVTDEVPYYAHSSEDTYDKVPARCLEHSAVVIALGALGTANLDHMLPREVLTAPVASAGSAGKATGSGCGSSCGGKSSAATSSDAAGSGCGSSCGSTSKSSRL